MLGRVAGLHNRLLFFWCESLRLNAHTGGLAASVTELVAWLAPAAQGAAADTQHTTRFVDACATSDRLGDQLDAIQQMGQIGKDFPWSNSVGVGQCVARDGLAAKAQVIEMLALHAQIDLDVAQRFTGGQLSKRQSQELIEAREVFDFVLSTPGQDHPAECLKVLTPMAI